MNNPETIDFVKGYPEKKDIQEKIDVSGDLTGEIPLFLQWDERWGYRQYGGDYMAVNGCGPTCLSMVWCGLTGKSKWNPYKVAGKAEKDGYYVKGAGTSWDLMTSGAKELGLSVENLSLDETQILNNLQQGNPIICILGPGDFTTQGHFLVLTGVDKNGKIIVNDPNSIKRSKKRWDLDRLMSQTRNLWAYSL
ncbi:MAG: C39 family peptidase [Lachnospiraceae bacterium]|nr:C39 family peptidase [Lachnospiraceae bacterium]